LKVTPTSYFSERSAKYGVPQLIFVLLKYLTDVANSFPNLQFKAGVFIKF